MKLLQTFTPPPRKLAALLAAALVALALAMPAMAQTPCTKASCKITIQTGDGSPFLKGCGEGADIGRIEYVLSSPNGQQSDTSGFAQIVQMQIDTLETDDPVRASEDLEYRAMILTGDGWQNISSSFINAPARTGATLDEPVVWEFRAKAGAVIGNSKGTGRQRTTMEILKIGGNPFGVSLESKHQVLFFLGGEGCGQWGFGHGHVYDPDTGERVR